MGVATLQRKMSQAKGVGSVRVELLSIGRKTGASPCVKGMAGATLMSGASTPRRRNSKTEAQSGHLLVCLVSSKKAKRSGRQEWRTWWGESGGDELRDWKEVMNVVEWTMPIPPPLPSRDVRLPIPGNWKL